ncbi:DNA gyrase C-terminal beta-propeller domain-containing protein, partial [Rhizobium ruizarguesonis]
SSSYDFRISGRGGKGIRATDTSKTGEIGELVAAFPVDDGDQIMLVSDGGQLIRVPVGGIRIASRATKGVTIFSTAKDEKVVSVERISEPEEDETEEAVEVVEGAPAMDEGAAGEGGGDEAPIADGDPAGPAEE